jgi:uncharacterized membrane protein YhhN
VRQVHQTDVYYVSIHAWVYVALAVLALGNWWSRYRDNRPVELVTKPAFTALVALLVVLVPVQPAAMRVWFVVGFVLCLAGDVFLMISDDLFVFGLASFLVGHLAFVVGLLANGRAVHLGPGSVVALVLVAAIGIGVGPRIVRGARANQAALGGPVVAYLGVITTMAVVAALKGNGWAIAGACAFVVSDALLGWNAFVRPQRHGSVAVMVTYHAALTGLLLAVLR